jgi:acyl-CoA synthetase (AMP-forming)/AMP-acid ligase II
MPHRCWMIDAFKQKGADTAVIDRGIEYRYADLYARIDHYLALIEKESIPGGSVVAILSDYRFDAIALFFALAEHAVIIVPIISETEDEIESRLESAEVDVLFVWEGDAFVTKQRSREAGRHRYIETLSRKKHAGLVLFSSGSTGEPKAMLHDLDVLIESYRGKGQKRLNTLIFLTFDHIGGIDTMLRIFAIGGTITIPASRQPSEICKLVEAHRVDVLPSSPTFLNLLLLSGLHRQYDLSSLKIIAFGAEPMPESLLHRLREIFPAIELQQKFGTSETNAIRVSSKSDDSLYMKFDDPNLEHKVIDGELWLKSKTQVLGYLNAPMDSFTEDGWFKTGDLVETTEDGYLRIVGRNKEVINVGGEKVLPSEVESILLDMDEFSDVMVYGESNPITGQSVVVEVVPADGIDKREAKKAIRRFCKDKLESYKIPSKVVIVDQTSFGERFKKIRRK